MRSFQNGEYALISQKLQKKILAVRDYLLDSEKKAEYDTSLKLQLQHQKAQSLPVAQALPTRPAPPKAAQSLPIRQSPPRAAQTPPVQDKNTDYSINPIVIIKESLDWLRHHRKVTSTIVKLACATVGIVILLIVLANGTSLLTFVVDKSSYLIAKVTGSSEEKVPDRPRTRPIPGAKSENPANTGENSGTENATCSLAGRQE